MTRYDRSDDRPSRFGRARPAASHEGAIELRHVSKHWGARAALRDVSFTFNAGETWVVSGRSGAGKSTLLNVIAGYAMPERGNVVRPRSIGYLLQTDVLLSGLTAAQNVRLAGAAERSAEGIDARVDRTLEDMGIAHRADVPVEFLSGGERQRVRLATVLIKAADVVLFDEPTSSLDPETTGEVLRLMDTAFVGKLRIVVSHDEHVRVGLRGARTLHLAEGTLHEGT